MGQRDAMLHPGEAARILGVSYGVLRRMAESGRLVSLQTLGGHRRYRTDDVLAVRRWMDAQR
jgi:excisionase family DNA binding protein